MTYFMESLRLGFSHWRREDLEYARLLWGNPEVTRLIGGKNGFSKEAIRERLKKEMRDQEQYGVQYWPVFLKENHCFIGCCGLHPPNENGEMELGYHLLPKYWNQGFATEAGHAVIDYAQNTLHNTNICAGHHPDNHASAKCLRKLGFFRVGEKLYPPTGLLHPEYRLKRLE